MTDTLVHTLPVSIHIDEVRRLLGYPADRKPSPPVAALLEPVLAEARRRARGRGLFERLPPSRAGALGLEPVEARALAVGLVTVGAAIEERASELVARGEDTAALILDAAGSAAAEEAADRLSGIIAERGERGDVSPTASCRMSPGYHGWPIACQAALFEVLPADALGVTLLPSKLMVPRKSVSFAMWLGATSAVRRDLGGCEQCPMDRCRYRRRTGGESRKGDER